MRTGIGIFLVMMMLNSCSDFSHVHYRKVKKVPAIGFVAPPTSASIKPNSHLFIGKIAPDSNHLVPTVSLQKEKTAAPKSIRVYKKKVSKEKKIFPFLRFKLNKPNYFKPIQKQESRKRDGSTFLVILFLFIGILLIVSGGIVLVMGILAPLFWMIGVGLLVFLLGLFPFIGLLTFAIGAHHPNPGQEQFKEK